MAAAKKKTPAARGAAKKRRPARPQDTAYQAGLTPSQRRNDDRLFASALAHIRESTPEPGKKSKAAKRPRA